MWTRHIELYESKASRQAVIEAAYQAFLTEWVAQGFPHPDDMSPDDFDQLSPRTPMTVLEMLHEYPDAREHLFRDSSFKLLDVEQPFIVPIDPENDKLWYCGRFDKLFEYRGQVIVGEHKTTATHAGTKKTKYTFKSNYIDSWSLSPQIAGYNFALRQLYGDRSGGVWVDCALVHKDTHDLFKFIPIEVKDTMLDSWLWNLQVWVDQIVANKGVLPERIDGDYLAAYPQNFHSCFEYNSACEFTDVCRMIPNPAKLTEPPMGFKEEFWSPFRILDLEKIGITPEMAGEPSTISDASLL